MSILIEITKGLILGLIGYLLAYQLVLTIWH
jgi:hypothetical protein